VQVVSVEKDAKYPNNQYFQGEAAVGRILLQTTSSVQQVKALQSVQVQPPALLGTFMPFLPAVLTLIAIGCPCIRHEMRRRRDRG
jgi:hypothetical protein